MPPVHKPLNIARQNEIGNTIADKIEKMSDTELEKYHKGDFFLEISSLITGKRSPYVRFEDARAQLFLKHGNAGIGAVGAIYALALLNKAKPNSYIEIVSRKGDICTFDLGGKEVSFEIKFATKTRESSRSFQFNFSASELSYDTCSTQVLGFMFDQSSKLGGMRSMLTTGRDIVDMFNISKQEAVYNLSVPCSGEGKIANHLSGKMLSGAISTVSSLRSIL